jgi:drug efflux transport system ATP-binding protein
MPETVSALPSSAVLNAHKEAALEFHAASKSFRSGNRTTVALNGVTLRLMTGVITGLVGPDGAGKTTLMRLAAGLLLPDRGTVRVFGLDTATGVNAIHAVIGYMPQRFGLYEDLTVQENLTLYADLHGVGVEQRLERFEQLTRMTGLAPFSARLAGHLSGGMKQKLGLACTLVSRPRLLLLDEPTVGVDPVSRLELWRIIGYLIGELGMTVIVSTAYLDEVERCAAVVVLDEGREVGHDTPDAFKAEMKGRCFHVTCPGTAKRDIQTQLSGRTGVIDAVIEGERVRLVVDSGFEPWITSLLPNRADAELESVAPRFEDAFIALLNKHRLQTGGVSRRTERMAADQRSVESGGEVIRVDGVDRWFGDFHAVKNLTFTVKQGEVFGLLGANGAGKTTTFRMLCGLLPASGGRLRVAGVDLRRAAAKARERIGYMSQKFSLYTHLTVRQNLEFFSSAYGLRNASRAQRIAWALEQFELEPVAQEASGDLPLGYKQRLAMACALMHEPQILFLDEPTSGVDPLARREFWNRTNRLAAQGITVLVTTHFMEDAEYCDRLVIMVSGEILASGRPADIKALVRDDTMPEPTMQQAFIRLVGSSEQGSDL